MAAAVSLNYRIFELPWTTDAEQEQGFRRRLLGFIGAGLVVALILSFLPTPERDPADIEQVSERYARLLLEQREPPPPPPVVEEVVPEPVLPEPEPVVEEAVEPEPVPVEVTPEPEPIPEPEPEPVDQVAEARERASVAGLLPFTQELQALRDTDLTESLGAAEDLGGAADTASAVTQRALIASNVGGSSGGIDTSSLSRNTGGSGIGTRETTTVENPVENIAPAGAAATRVGQSDLGSRSREEIERIFDRNKGAIYTLYNRALRTNPTLQGKVVLRLTILPNGTVSACEVVSSELGDPDLELRLVQRVLLFQFEPKDVEAVTTTKPIDFFPA